MIMCIQNLVKLCPIILKILSKNQILKSINGPKSVAILRKMTLYNANVDHVTANMYTKEGRALTRFLPTPLEAKNQKLLYDIIFGLIY